MMGDSNTIEFWSGFRLSVVELKSKGEFAVTYRIGRHYAFSARLFHVGSLAAAMWLARGLAEGYDGRIGNLGKKEEEQI